MGKITDELFLQREHDNRGNHILYLSQNFWRGLDCRDDRPDRLRDIHCGDFLVLSAIEFEGIADIDIRGFPALRSDLGG